jgi:hypothetical protein
LKPLIFQPPSTLRHWVWFGFDVQFCPPSEIGCEKIARSFHRPAELAFAQGRKGAFSSGVRFGMSNMNRDQAIDELCMLKVSAVAPQYLAISAPTMAYSPHGKAQPPNSSGITAQEALFRQILVVLHRERGVVIDRLGPRGELRPGQAR